MTVCIKCGGSRDGRLLLSLVSELICLRDITPSIIHRSTFVDPENDRDTTLTRTRTTARTIICSDALRRELLLVERLAFQL
jgi:hypothetical protein